ncbi:MAG: hypothetical protein QM831_43550 [Kofleriaceae bacterium]
MKTELLLLVAISGCHKDDKAAAPPPPSPMVVAPPIAEPAKPGTLNLAAVPALGAADKLEPPSRDIVPGMTIAEALAKGAKRDSVDYTLTWKQDVLDLWIAKESNLVVSVEATYKKADFDALAAKWGKPNWGEGWIGANWVASLNGCQSECTVSFARSPLVFLGPTPAPPLGLATLTPSSTIADVQKIAGVPLTDRNGVETGFGLSIGVDGSDNALEAIVVSSHKGGDDDVFATALDKTWGKRIERGDTFVWFTKDHHWAVESGKYGDTVRYTPILPFADELAKLRTIPAKLWGKTKAAMPELKEDALELPHNEISFGGNSNGATVNVSYDDKGVVSELRMQINATEQTMKQLTTAFETSFGKPVKSEDDMKLTVDGVPFVVVYDGTTISLTADVPQS